MPRAGFWAVSGLMVLAGCAGDGAPGPSGNLDTDSADDGPRTIEDLLSNLTHVRVPLSVDLTWDLEDASAEAAEGIVSLVYFPKAAPVSGLSVEAPPLLVAFVPISFPETAGTCGAPPDEVGAYAGVYLEGLGGGFGGGGGGGMGGQQAELAAQFTDHTFGPGWYHAIVVANEPTTVTVTFGDDNSPPERAMPNVDPYVRWSFQSPTGSRDHVVEAPAQHPWLVWSSFDVDGNTQDGGYTMDLSIGADCVSASETPMPPLPFGQARHLNAAAAGSARPASVEATYAPTLTATASMSATLSIVALQVEAVTLPTDGSA